MPYKSLRTPSRREYKVQLRHLPQSSRDHIAGPCTDASRCLFLSQFTNLLLFDDLQSLFKEQKFRFCFVVFIYVFCHRVPFQDMNKKVDVRGSSVNIVGLSYMDSGCSIWIFGLLCMRFKGCCLWI